MPTVTRTLSSLRPIAGPFHSTVYGVSDLMTGLNSTSSPSLTAKSDREFTNRGRSSGRSVMHIASDRDWGEILGGEGIYGTFHQALDLHGEIFEEKIADDEKYRDLHAG